MGFDPQFDLSHSTYVSDEHTFHFFFDTCRVDLSFLDKFFFSARDGVTTYSTLLLAPQSCFLLQTSTGKGNEYVTIMSLFQNSPQQSRAYTIGHPPWSNHIFSRRKLFCISFQIRSERRTDSWKLLLPIVLRKAFFPPCFRWEKQRDRSGDLSWNEYDWFTSDLLQAISSLNLPLFFFLFRTWQKKRGRR